MKFLAKALALVLLAAMPSGLAQAQEAFTPAQRDALRAIIVETLRSQPELVLEALQALERRQEEEQRATAKRMLVEKRRDLFEDAGDPSVGNPQARTVLVEFFDYRCPYCKQMDQPLKALLSADPDLRIVRKDLPVLGPASVVAARAARASRAPNKYAPVHAALMGFRGSLDEAAVFRIAGEVGLDVARLRRDMEAPEIAQRLQKNASLAQALQINGTPAFAIGDTLVPGAVDLATMRSLIAEARAKR
ncbi:MAG: DsbA family protein [Rhodospirillales bacterium]